MSQAIAMRRVDRDEWNTPRYVAGRPHYESWFVRANHPDRPLALWIRHTIFAPKSGEAEGEIWAVFFDGERRQTVAAYEAHPIDRCRLAARGLDVVVGNARVLEGEASGSASSWDHALAWQLRFKGDDAPLALLDPSWYRAPFPRAKVVAPVPRARFDGTMTIDGRTFEIRGWAGSQNHNWGSRHTDAYAWGQVVGFDGAPDVVLECATARVRLGPVWTPWATLIVLRHQGEEITSRRVRQAFLADGTYHIAADALTWSFSCRDRGRRLRGLVSAPPSAFVGLRYRNPPGGEKICINTKIARCEVTIESAHQAPVVLRSGHGAAFEIVLDDAPVFVPLRG